MVITGATSGIGLATALRAAAKGARLFLIARGEAALARIAADIVRDGGDAEYAAIDVADREAMETAADSAVGRFGRIDTWVNCAGVAVYAKLMELPDDEHRRLFDTNYFGVVNGTGAAARRMRGKGGVIITVASIASDFPSPILGAYAASKHAVAGFIGSFRIELEADKSPLRLTLVKPSGMATPIADHARNHRPGRARVPPPAYDPELAADAIIACAGRYRRELTVGGFGRAQTLFAAHLPKSADWISTHIISWLSYGPSDPARKDALFTAAGGGKVRSDKENGRSFSVYNAVAGRPMRAVLVAGALAGAMGLAARLRSGKALPAEPPPRR